ncbi:unnamed protein product [Fusarium graminearum]|uniref:Chromosome 4, complete genome n=1 Tax=Gibberella zeae (strain ATCC MYA-4620 / CBS 123657 / FGSC 9075 / NRRL 31084 / PH-1) TaxID=229533 RepID=I1S871_GIBZE|nr:hypothetical protein FGSG_13049 [Fusarium graminearum PH-1]ESU13232.1 hypothetical protein FGSG_13049 [Fusarium graminearum PH-1]CEF85118.1 unnamed protein product [Fusarium graminearum]CZS72824.1 unnamed protein product [Fusarium graminearum]|eukprot:XP_011326739.1 hypothetical protein FGSG_13049 [Fusarium graminearum PH-1]
MGSPAPANGTLDSPWLGAYKPSSWGFQVPLGPGCWAARGLRAFTPLLSLSLSSGSRGDEILGPRAQQGAIPRLRWMEYRTTEAEDAQQWGELPHVTSNCMPFSALSLFVLGCIRPAPATPKPTQWSSSIHVFAAHHNKDRETRKQKLKKYYAVPRVSLRPLPTLMNMDKANLLNGACRDDLLLVMVGACLPTSSSHAKPLYREQGFIHS